MFIIRLTILCLCAFASLYGQAPYVLHFVAGENFPNGSVATEISLGNVSGLAVDSSGNLAIYAGAVYRVTPDGKISILAQTTPENMLFTGLGFRSGITADYQGNLYTIDVFTIQKIDSTGRVSDYFSLAVDNEELQPFATAVDVSGNLYIANNKRDQSTPSIYKVSPDGSYATPPFGLDLNASAAIAVDAAGNIYVLTGAEAVVWKVDSSGNITRFAGTGTSGSSGDGGPATLAMLGNPQSLAIDNSGNVYIADGTIRKVDTSGIITTVWTPVNSFFGLVAVDANGNLYAWSEADDIVYRRSPTGAVSAFAGNGPSFSSGDGGPATSAQVGAPIGMLLDASGDLLFADSPAQFVKLIPKASSQQPWLKSRILQFLTKTTRRSPRLLSLTTALAIS
jgi:hypothetical protein